MTKGNSIDWLILVLRPFKRFSYAKNEWIIFVDMTHSLTFPKAIFHYVNAPLCALCQTEFFVYSLADLWTYQNASGQSRLPSSKIREGKKRNPDANFLQHAAVASAYVITNGWPGTGSYKMSRSNQKWRGEMTLSRVLNWFRLCYIGKVIPRVRYLVFDTCLAFHFKRSCWLRLADMWASNTQ